MDNLIAGGEALYRDLRALARHFPSRLPVRAIGYLAGKRDQVRRTPERLSFCFILRGEGEFRQGRRTWPVRSPAAIVQRPGLPLEHGPAGNWDELYVNYVPELVPVFEALHLLTADRPVWQAHDADAMREGAREILDALRRANEFGMADRLDRLCERLILDTLIADIAPPAAEGEKSIKGARAYLESHFREPVDFDELALDYGMSPSDFRRKWRGLMPAPPGQYQAQLRIREACRLLVETDRSVGEIARAVGFDDQLYFARRFRRLVGETASAYRAGHRQREEQERSG